MTRAKVANEIFPLKELRVRGEIQNSLTLYQDNTAVIDKQIFALREAFGTFPFAVGGGKILLDPLLIDNHFALWKNIYD